jgi:hypothetical protein
MFDPPDPKGRWPRLRTWLRRRRGVVAVVMVVVVVAAGLIYLFWPEDPCGGSESGLRQEGGQCVGVTAGDHVFHESFADVQRKILAENDKVSGSGRAVTVALLDPLTVTDTSAVTAEQVRYELEGAYTAQYRINNTAAVGDKRPLVKLVLANWGSHEMQWRTVVEQLEGMVDDPEPLVAVVGLRLSTKQTEEAAKHLGRHNIPTVSAVATADELNAENIHGFVRVSPPNTEYVAALQGYLRHHRELDSTMTVYDTNSDIPFDSRTGAGSDLFTKSLRDDFDEGLKHLYAFPKQGFAGKSGPTRASPDLFTNVTANICAVKPKIVPFAGRVGDFASFLESLRSRACPDTPLTVIAAGADFGVLGLRSQAGQLREKNLTIVYATETDAQGWVQGAPRTPRYFMEFYEEFRRQGFDPAGLDEGGAITTHDALLVAAKAARLSTSSHSENALPSNVDVLNQMLNLNGLNEVPGASGQLRFSSRGANSGNPSNKPVPVIEIPSAAVAQTPEVHHTK